MSTVTVVSSKNQQWKPQVKLDPEQNICIISRNLLTEYLLLVEVKKNSNFLVKKAGRYSFNRGFSVDTTRKGKGEVSGAT